MKKVRVLSSEQNESKPFLVTFPQNHPSKRFLVQNEDENFRDDIIDFDLYRHKLTKDKSLIYGHNRKFDWVGSNTSKPKKVQGAKYLIGFYSDDSKHMNIIESEDIFDLKQHSKNEVVEEEKEGEKKPGLRAIEQKKILLEAFGNTRSKKMMDALKTSIVTENKISDAGNMRDLLMEKAVEFEKDLEEKKEDPLSSFIQSKKETLPEFNLEADEPAKIYNLHSIIPSEEFDTINNKEYIAAVKKDNVLEKGKKQYTKFVYQELEASKKGNRTFKDGTLGSKMKCLVYLNCLLKLLDMKFIHKAPEQLCEELKIQPASIKSILNRFFIASTKEQDKTVYTRNTLLTDKLICYILVLALIYGDFETDATALVANMKIDPKKFAKYCEEIGASVHKKKSDGEEKVVIKLGAPLVLKPPSNKKAKK